MLLIHYPVPAYRELYTEADGVVSQGYESHYPELIMHGSTQAVVIRLSDRFVLGRIVLAHASGKALDEGCWIWPEEIRDRIPLTGHPVGSFDMVRERWHVDPVACRSQIICI
jgi:hypothetical protein